MTHDANAGTAFFLLPLLFAGPSPHPSPGGRGRMVVSLFKKRSRLFISSHLSTINLPHPKPDFYRIVTNATPGRHTPIEYSSHCMMNDSNSSRNAGVAVAPAISKASLPVTGASPTPVHRVIRSTPRSVTPGVFLIHWRQRDARVSLLRWRQRFVTES